jgi:4-amino-4-deoxy-L-arabinose transferase-like glycosyltransferase
MEKIERADRWLLALILIVLAAWIYLLPPIWNHGEAREGLVVRSIVLDHQWILPFRNDEVPSKPPLFHWIGASLAHLFGLSDFTVRLPSVLAAWIVALITFVLGAATGGRKTAWLAVGALLGMYQFWVSATEARVDMVFSACVTISIAGFFFWLRDGREGARALSYLAAACAVLAKGPVGAALPGIVIVSFLVVERRFAAIWQFISWPLLALALAIDLGWYALAYRIGGSEFVAWQIMHENVDQLLGTHGFESNKTTLSMLGWIPTRTFPWNLALLWVLVRRLRGERQDSTGRFLVVWWAAITAFFFLVNIKRAVYLLPTYPAVALLAARALATIMDRAGAARDDSAGITSAQLRWWQRALCTPGRAALAVALVDLALILPNPMIWKRSASYKTRLAFIDGIGAQVPPGTPLYAGPKLGESDLLIIAYRTRRTIARKPIACARPNEYFLSGMKPSDFDGVKIRRLAASEKNNVALAVVLAPPPGKPCSSETPKHEDDSDTE